MKKVTKDLLLVSAIMALGAATLWAQPVPTTPPPATAPATNGVGSKMQIDQLLYDFGRVKSGEPVKHTYYFTNTGDALLVLKGVQPQCGCTAAGDWTKEVEPGKSGKIPIQFNSTGYNGPVFKQVTVTCNVSNQPVVILQLKGTVYKQIDLNPAFVAMTVPADATSATATVTITNNSEEPLELSAPESNSRALAATLVTNTPGRGFHLLLKTTDPLLPGSSQAQISIKTSLTNMPILTVPVYVNVQPPLVVVPARISAPAGPLAGAVTNSVTIQNNSTNLLTLTDPQVNYPGVGVEIREMQPGRTFTALVSFPAGFELNAGQQVELTIKSSSPKMPLVKVPVSQIPRPPQAAMPPPTAPATVPVKAITPPPLPPGK